MRQVTAKISEDRSELLVPLDDIPLPEADEQAKIWIRDAYAQRYLGPDGLQERRHDFTDLAIDTDSHGEAAVLRFPAALCEGIAEFTPMEIGVNGEVLAFAFPGGVQRAGRRRGRGRITEGDGVKPPEPPAPPINPTDTVPRPAELPPPRSARRTGGVVWLGVALLLGLTGGAGIGLYHQQIGAGLASLFAGNGQDDEPTSPCSRAGLLVGAPKFEVAIDRLERCGDEIDAETAFAVLEYGEQSGSAEASYLIGTLYAGDIVHGIKIDPDPTLAARQFREAIRREPEHMMAGTRLDALCAEMERSNSALTRAAYNEACTLQ